MGWGGWESGDGGKLGWVETGVGGKLRWWGGGDIGGHRLICVIAVQL